MRKFAVFILSIFVGFPAIAAGLPIVNIGAASVSARAAFGELTEHKAQSTEPIAKLSDYQLPAPKSAPGPQRGDGNQKSAILADVLSPKRPSNDLWATNDRTLRMPDANEFAVIRPDFQLPEESLDVGARVVIPGERSGGKERPNREIANLDTQIEKLVELQRRADESVKQPLLARAEPKPVKIESRTVVARPSTKHEPLTQTINTKSEPKISRVVVPMDEPTVRAIPKSAIRNQQSKMDYSLASLSPAELKKAFKKTYMSENKHLSAYRIDERFDVVSDVEQELEGFTSARDLSEDDGGVRTLEIKIGFKNDDSALSRDNYNLLSEYASLVVSNPRRAIQISIPENATRAADGRKLAARRLAIVEQVLKDTGVSDARIMPVLVRRNDDSFVLRVISSDTFETLSQQKRDMFGDTISKKSSRSMSW